MKNNYKKLFLLFVGLTSSMMFSQKVCLIDFSGTDVAQQSTGNWNNAISTIVQDPAINIPNLISDTGVSTGFSLSNTTPFNGVNANGAITLTGAASIFPTTASMDSFFGNTALFNNVSNPIGVITFSGLDPAKLYSFEIFASRNGVGDVRSALYTVTGATTTSATLDAANNSSLTTVTSAINPDSSGVITLQAEKNTDNTNGSGFFYLGAIKMVETTGILSVNQNIFQENSITLYPNPVSDELNIRFTLENTSKSSFSIYDLSGRLIFEEKNNLNQSGTYSYKWSRKSNNGTRV